MKFFAILCAGIMLFMFVTEAYAAPVGNIASPSLLKRGLFSQGKRDLVGYFIATEYDFVADRNLVAQTDDAELRLYGGRAGVILWDRVMAYGLAGTAQADQEYTFANNKVGWETDLDFAWGVGATLLLYEAPLHDIGGVLNIGIDGKYRRFDLDVSEVTVNGVEYGSSNAGLTDTDFEMYEWQIAMGISYRAEKFVTYGGIKISDVGGNLSATIPGNTFYHTMDSADNFGLFIGAEYLIMDGFSLGVEGRFIDETAISTIAKARY